MGTEAEKVVPTNSAIFKEKHEKRLQHWYTPVNIARFLRAPILKNIFERQWLSYKLWVKTAN